MDRFHQLQVFVAVAEEAGFAAAARRLNMSPPAVTRAIAALEQSLGVKLLQRTTRYVRMTDVGQRYLDDARRVLAALEAADESAMGNNTTPRGTLTVTAPVLFGRMHVMPVIAEYLSRYPDVTVNALFLDRVVGLVEEGIDVAVRIGHLPDSSLRALPVGEIRSLLVASPEYLQRQGYPSAPDDLEQHELVASTAGAGSGSYWYFRNQAHRQDMRVGIQPRLVVTTNDAAIEAVQAGVGITRINSYQVSEPVLAGKLEILLPEYECPARPIHIVHREDRLGASKNRVFIDLLAQRLRNNRALQSFTV
ncbi:MAG: LysR family transcriptional regulator [Oceanobacter sp.]